MLFGLQYCFFLFFFLIISPALACRSLNYEPSLEKSDVAFIGKAVTITRLQETTDGLIPFEAVFVVQKMIKGENTDIALINHKGNHCYSSTLDPFVLGETSLVFAEYIDGQLQTYHPLPITPYYEDSYWSRKARQFVGSLESE